MHAPHPALRELYRQAGTPLVLADHERRERDIIAGFEVDLSRAGMSGEDVLAPLVSTIAPGGQLGASLERMPRPALVDVEAPTPRPRRIWPPAPPVDAARQRIRQHNPHTPAFEPERQPRLAALVAKRASKALAPVPAALVGQPAGALPADVAPDSRGVKRSSAWIGPEVALQRLVQIADRAGAGGAIHHPMTRRATQAPAPDAVGDSPVTPGPGGYEIERETGDAAAPIDPLNERLMEVLGRIQAASPAERGGSSRDAATGLRRPDRVPMTATGAPSGPLATFDDRGPTTSRAASRIPGLATPPHLASPSDRGTAITTRVGGLRGLAVLAESMRAGQAKDATPPPQPPATPPSAPVIDPDQLAYHVTELLRREAERQGIDLAGLEP